MDVPVNKTKTTPIAILNDIKNPNRYTKEGNKVIPSTSDKINFSPSAISKAFRRMQNGSDIIIIPIKTFNPAIPK